MLKYKIIIAGSKNVGKSSLIARFCDDVFYEKTKETIGVSFERKKIEIKDNLIIETTIWDFGGEEKYRILFPSYIKGASAALILYDTTRKQTLDDVKNWVELIDSNSKDMIKVTIGTKIDLKEQREVSKNDIIKMSKKLNCDGEPIGTSAKTGENVEKAFLYVATELVNRNLQECKSCGEYFQKKINFCNYCGEKSESNSIPI